MSVSGHPSPEVALANFPRADPGTHAQWLSSLSAYEKN